MESIIAFLSSSLGDTTEKSNMLLAQSIVNKKDKSAVDKLFALLTNADKKIKNDCIKVIDEIAVNKPEYIIPYIPHLIQLLKSDINRLVWGAMVALSNVAHKAQDAIYDNLGEILMAADRSSIIANDKCVKILVTLAKVKDYTEDLFPLLIERIMKSAENQLPTYAARTFEFVNKNNKHIFIETLHSRLSYITYDIKRKILLRLIKEANKI